MDADASGGRMGSFPDGGKIYATVVMQVSAAMCRAARRCSAELAPLSWTEPVAHVYAPLDYAWDVHRRYLERFAARGKRVLFLGMNPGPFGMAQTGVPFGEVAAVRDWLGLAGKVGRPPGEHPKRPVAGFACRRSEVSGRRLWGLFASRWGTPERFFEEHFVHNYCPLLFLEASGRNRTPDKLPSGEAAALETVCDRYLVGVLRILQPAWVIGVGAFAEQRARAVAGALPEQAVPRVGRILHPSPASPAANRDWAGEATRELERLGVWSS